MSGTLAGAAAEAHLYRMIYNPFGVAWWWASDLSDLSDLSEIGTRSLSDKAPALI